MAVWFVLGYAAAARAQSAPLAGRVELGAGVLWTGTASLGSIDATETTGAGSRMRIFSTSTEIASAAGIEGRVAVRVSRMLEAEGSAAYARPQLDTTLANDIEAPGTVIASERLSQFTFGGGVLWYVPIRNISNNLRPFVSGGFGYLRHLHESGTLAANGQSYQFGGGVKYLFASRPQSHLRGLRGLGLRIDARILARRRGVAFDDVTRLAPGVGASIFARF